MNLEIGIYVHIPFCEQKCPYCDFNSYAGLTALHDAYVEAVCQDMASIAAHGREAEVRYVARTLFFGGGTPTLLAPPHFEKLMRSAQEHFGWHPGLETTTEANPGTIDRGLVRDLRGLGINRISLGVQSLNDDMLRHLGRIHDSRQARDAADVCRKGGIENLNLDLMFGLPNQTLAQWKTTLEQALSIGPEHLSLYPLTIEQGTRFFRLQELGRLPLPDDDAVAEMYDLADELLDSTYQHYEISNWARKAATTAIEATPFRCQHNLIYWRNEPYIGLGAGAHSYLQSERYAVVSEPADYIHRVTSGLDPVEIREPIDLGTEMAETMILGLRLSEGVNRDQFRARFSRELNDVLGSVLAQAAAKGLIHDNGDAVALSDQSRFVSNEVFVPILEHLRNNGAC